MGAYGAAAFFRSRGAEAAARGVERDWADEKRLGAFWAGLAREIDSAYAAWPTDSAARVLARDSVYARARRQLVDSLAPLMTGVDTARLARVPLNNAVLLARRTYARELDLFDAALEQSGHDLRRAIEAIRKAVEGAPDPFAALRARVASR